MNEHYQGRVEACGNVIRTKRESDGSGGFMVAECPANVGSRIEDARRLAACWNACLGATTEWLETQEQVVLLGPPIADRFRELEQERDKLLSALRTALAAMQEAEIVIGDHSIVPADLLNAIADANGAISKHQGQQHDRT